MKPNFNYLLCFFGLCRVTLLTAQVPEVTFYKDVQPIIHTNCTPCHQPGKAGPFSLITYADVSNKADFIFYVTKIKYMPPWQADPSYQTYLNERLLTEKEIETIQRWIAQGKKEGDIENARKVEIATGPYPQRPPDLSLSMSKPFVVDDSGKDDYRFFSIPTNLPEDTYLEAIEFVPGNKRVVHHSRIMTDTTHKVRSIDGLSANDSAIWQFNKYPPLDRFLYGWVPGNFPIFFPEGTGKKIHKQADLILNIHYAPSSIEEEDQSSINFYFAKDPIDKEVKTITITEEHITNPPFVIRANTIPLFYAEYKIDTAIQAISVMPHMHYLGKYFKAYALAPDGTEIPLIKINKWDFNWQTSYQFKELIDIPAGSAIKVEASYDNTANNPANPSFPPRDVFYGWNTTSEMMNMVIYYLEK